MPLPTPPWLMEGAACPGDGRAMATGEEVAPDSWSLRGSEQLQGAPARTEGQAAPPALSSP